MQIIVYRTSQIGGTAGSWVPTKLEVHKIGTYKLPADSFVAFSVPAGEITLSATEMINFHYADENHMTLRQRVNEGEIVYFRILSVFGGCEAIHEKVASGVVASTTHYPRPGWAQTTCFHRVPEAVALKELQDLRRGY